MSVRIKEISISIDDKEIKLPINEARKLYHELGTFFGEPVSPQLPYKPWPDPGRFYQYPIITFGGVSI